MWKKIIEILMTVPVVNLIPLLLVVLADFPKRFENLPDETKQELFEALVAAATKAALNYSEVK